MKILLVDVGTGTQDVFLYDSDLDIENGYKLIVPSPTMMVHRRVKQATRRGVDIVLSGVLMGGGPSHWAVEAHIQEGYKVFATPDAAKSFNDDLSAIKEMGIEIIGGEELSRIISRGAYSVEMKDFDFQMIEEAFSVFDVDLKGLSAVAVGVFDHGDAPPGYSDRQFRFDYLDERIRISNKLSGFAYRSPDVPEIMTRLQAVVDSSKKIVDVPLVVMDTAPAAVLGATYDVQVKGRERVLIANVGNFHTLAFRLGGNGIEGVFEHHTGLLDTQKLDSLLYRLADNTLTHEEVFNSHGHGALIYTKEPFKFPKDSYQVVLTGPRRSLMNSSSLSVHYAAPFGDMMISGCFGLLSAVADLIPELAEPIYSSLNAQGGSETAPWDSE